MESSPWPRVFDDHPMWKEVNLRLDKPTLDLAKLFTWEKWRRKAILIMPVLELSIVDAIPMVADLLDLGADAHLVLCEIRTDDDNFFYTTLDTKPETRLHDGVWASRRSDGYLHSMFVPLLDATRGSCVETIEAFSQRGARINKIIERVASYEQNIEILANPFGLWQGTNHLVAVLSLIEPGQGLISRWLGVGVENARYHGRETDLEVIETLLSLGSTPSYRHQTAKLTQGLIKLSVQRWVVPATLSIDQPDLIIAARSDDFSVCNEALGRSPNTKIRGNFGMTALMLSVGGKSTSVCQLLLDRGADPNTRDVFGMTPLMDAVYFGHREAILLLLSSGADADYCVDEQPLVDFIGGTTRQYYPHDEWLYQRNIVARKSKENGWNACHLAAHRGFTEILSILVSHGADLNVIDNDGLYPADLAVKNGHESTAAYLNQASTSIPVDPDQRAVSQYVRYPESGVPGEGNKPAPNNDKNMRVIEGAHIGAVGSASSSQQTAVLCGACFKSLESGNFADLKPSDTLCRLCKMMTRSKSVLGQIRVSFHQDSNSTCVKFSGHIGLEETHRVRKLPDPWHSILRHAHSLDDVDTGSAAAMLIAINWHAICTREHTQCRPNSQTGYFPTRILDIRSSITSDQVCLVHDPFLRTPYVALSHRWGTEKLPVTIRANLASRLQGFDTTGLTPTMIDAIRVVRSLGYDYIWIDALCIVQDSEEDWLSEASQMSNVFSNAAVTIAVGDAVEHSQGIFRNRRTTFTRPFPIPYLQARPYRERAHMDGDGEYYLFQDTHGVRSKGPLDTRGWILQEQLLSPSILYFDKGEIFWGCITTTASESSPISASLLSEIDPDEVWALKYIRRLIAGSENSDIRRTRISTAWLEIIRNYSDRALTKANDRLIALQGIITPLSKILQDDPIAGMWRTQLWRQLTWWLEKSARSTAGGFTAPSWSWLSVPGRVYYHNSLLGERPEEDRARHKYLDLREYSFMVDEAVATNLDGNAGVIGTMTVTAKTFPYRLTQMDLKKPVYKRWHAAKLKTNTGRWMLDRSIDLPIDIQCLIVAEDTVAKSLVLLCIVPAQDAKQDGVWRRIGLCHWDGLAWQIPSSIGMTPETGTFTLV